MFSKLKTLKLSYMLALVVISSLLFKLSVNLQLAYHVQQPLFLFDFKVLTHSFTLPGGFINYVANFFTELYYYPITGAFILTLIITVIPLLVYKGAVKKLNEPISIILSSLVFLLSIILFVNYSFKLSSFLLLIGAYLFANLNIISVKQIKNLGLKISLLLIISVISFIVLGGLGLLVSNLILLVRIIIGEASKKEKFILTTTLILFNAIIPILFVHTFYQLVPLFDAYFSDLIINEYYQSPKLYYCLIGLLIIIEVSLNLYPATSIFKKDWNYLATYIAFGLLIGLLPNFFIDKNEKGRIEIDFLAYNKQWSKLLKTADTELVKVRLSAFQVNRAIYYTKGLLEDAFFMPQYFGIEALIVDKDIIRPVLMPSSDIYYDLGFINESRHWAHEAYTSFGKQPRILRRLVEVNIINQKYNTASKYIMLLKKSMIQRAWAIEQEKYLFNEPLIAKNITYTTKRENLPTEDFFTSRLDPAETLRELTKQSDNNNMAFEYLVANYLLKHEIIHIVNLIPDFRKYKYPKLPQLVQEALILYMIKTKKQSMDLSGYQIDTENIKRIQDYSKLYNLHLNHDKKAKEKLDNQYAKTYWYYIHFVSPITNKK